MQQKGATKVKSIVSKYISICHNKKHSCDVRTSCRTTNHHPVQQNVGSIWFINADKPCLNWSICVRTSFNASSSCLVLIKHWPANYRQLKQSFAAFCFSLKTNKKTSENKSINIPSLLCEYCVVCPTKLSSGWKKRSVYNVIMSFTFKPSWKSSNKVGITISNHATQMFLK